VEFPFVKYVGISQLEGTTKCFLVKVVRTFSEEQYEKDANTNVPPMVNVMLIKAKEQDVELVG